MTFKSFILLCILYLKLQKISNSLVEKMLKSSQSRIAEHSLPGGSVVKNFPANARRHGFDPRPGRSPMPAGTHASVPPTSRACASEPGESQLLKLACPRACAPQEERPPMRSPHTALERSRCSPPEKSRRSNKDPAQPKKKTNNCFKAKIMNIPKYSENEKTER